MKHKTFIILLQTLLILVLIGYIWMPDETEPAPVNASDKDNTEHSGHAQDLRNRINALEQAFESELTARLQLEKRLRQLEQKQPLATASPEALSVTPSNLSINKSSDTPSAKNPSIQQRLISQGLPVTTVNMIKSHIDSRRLERLQLRNQAIRNGWQDSDEFIEQMYQLSDISRDLRQQFGEKIYDHYLYASGEPNRVEVRETIGGSVAESAGIQTGDIILRYANEPIYKMIDLRRITSEGTPGEGTLLEIARNNQLYSLTVPRGPLGILMDYTRLRPNP